MDIMWVAAAQDDKPAFSNNDSAYTHYWLSTLSREGGEKPLPGKRRSVIDQTSRLDATTQDLIDRAFSS